MNGAIFVGLLLFVIGALLALFAFVWAAMSKFEGDGALWLMMPLYGGAGIAMIGLLIALGGYAACLLG